MASTVADLIGRYDPGLPLEAASTPPASWYVDPRVHALEREATFARNWQFAARADQVREPGQFATCEVAGEPLVVVRGDDGVLRGFFNICRHHAAAVVTDPEGCARSLRCPYHGWTYTLRGALKGTPQFMDEAGFDREANGLVPVDVAQWEQWVFVRIERGGPSLADTFGQAVMDELRALRLDTLLWFERRHYLFDCNWKVFVDNYLDGGYHVPHLHAGLDSVLDFKRYTVENGTRHCLQSSPVVAGGDPAFARVRGGDRALYYWFHPGFMLNWYEGRMDTNIVRPLGVDRTEVVFDFWFADVSGAAREHNLASVAAADLVQHEDVAICHSVQRGLRSRAYDTGRLSARREAGEHLFHRLLHAELSAQLRRGG